MTRRQLQYVCQLSAILLLLGGSGCGSSSTSTSSDKSDSGVTANGSAAPATRDVTLMNVSYDATRELWKALNPAFIDKHFAETGVRVTIKQSHGASGSQARSIIDGLEGDVATLSIWSDTDSLRKKGLIHEGWESQFPNRSLPYTSTVVFVTRQGNPRKITDWSDLVQEGVSVITPNPKTSGNGKLSFLAAWGSVIARGGSEDEAREFVTKLYSRVPVLDTGARGSTTTFAQKGIGDVHLALESEAKLEVHEANGVLQIVYPPQSILHEPHVALVDRVVDQRGTRTVAEAYLNFLFTPEGQEIITRHHFRPTNPDILKAHSSQFPTIKMFLITDFVPDWDVANAKFFADGAIFDSIYSSVSR